MKTERAESFGGVVHRTGADGRTEVVIVGRREAGVWGLPKGTPNKGESVEETALREVREETGLQVEIERKIDVIDYWFVRAAESTRYHKFVHFYLMRPTGGDLSLHDEEHDLVEWMALEEARSLMTYENEAAILEMAAGMVGTPG